eukprot:1030369-Pleurochrysis_carterae.AAC.1
MLEHRHPKMHAITLDCVSNYHMHVAEGREARRRISMRATSCGALRLSSVEATEFGYKLAGGENRSLKQQAALCDDALSPARVATATRRSSRAASMAWRRGYRRGGRSRVTQGDLRLHSDQAKARAGDVGAGLPYEDFSAGCRVHQDQGIARQRVERQGRRRQGQESAAGAPAGRREGAQQPGAQERQADDAAPEKPACGACLPPCPPNMICMRLPLLENALSIEIK